MCLRRGIFRYCSQRCIEITWNILQVVWVTCSVPICLPSSIPYHRQYRVLLNVSYLFALVIAPYLVYLFFGVGFNPFFKPRNPAKRSKWKRGRAMAFSTILGIVSALVLYMTMEISMQMTIAIGIIVTLLFAAAFSARKISRFFWGR